MILYFIKFTLILSILFSFYILFLEKENMHVFKRFYLLLSIAAAFLIPLLTITHYVDPIFSETVLQTSIQNTIDKIPSAFVPLQRESAINYWALFLWSIYALGVLLFGIRFVINLANLTKKIKQNTILRSGPFSYVLVSDSVIPHTFLHYIFFNKQKYEAQLIPTEVLLHEQVHAQQKHSIDILCLELLQIVCWFHPLFYFIKKSIKLNHEFLADNAVLKDGFNPTVYQQILLHFSTAPTNRLTNAINYISLRKRFTLMNTHTPKNAIRLRSLLVLPLLLILIYGFSDTKIAQKENFSKNSNLFLKQQKATPKQLAEYNTLAKKYNAQPKEHRIVVLSDLERLEYLYKLMSPTQKKNAEPFPEFPPPPPAPSAPLSLEDENQAVQPPLPPKPPISPLDHIIEMAKIGATFIYAGKKISSDKAIELLKKNDEISISTKKNALKKPVVYLRSKPKKTK